MILYRLKQEKIDPLKGCLIILGAVAAVAIVYYLFSFLAFALHMAWIQLMAFAAVIIAVVLVARKKFVEYTYVINDGSFFVNKSSGRKEKPLVETELGKIVWIGSAVEIPEEYAAASVVKNTFKKKNTAQAVIYRDEKSVLRGTLISPSEKFLAALKRAAFGEKQESKE